VCDEASNVVKTNDRLNSVTTPQACNGGTQRRDEPGQLRPRRQGTDVWASVGECRSKTRGKGWTMKFLQTFSLAVILLAFAACATVARCTPLPDAPNPQHAVEYDPGAWYATGAFTTGFAGAVSRPWVGLASGLVVDVAANTKDKRNMGFAVLGSLTSYVILKTIERNWHHKAGR